MKENINSQ
jgi:predicted RNase H-like nuclease (RuvC/YqgF family)